MLGKNTHVQLCKAYLLERKFMDVIYKVVI